MHSPRHCLRRRWRHNTIQVHDVTIATQRILPRARMNGTAIALKSADRRSNITRYLHEQGLNHACLTVFISRVIKWNCFSKIWHISLPRILGNTNLQCLRRTDVQWWFEKRTFVKSMCKTDTCKTDVWKTDICKMGQLYKRTNEKRTVVKRTFLKQDIYKTGQL